MNSTVKRAITIVRFWNTIVNKGEYLTSSSPKRGKKKGQPTK